MLKGLLITSSFFNFTSKFHFFDNNIILFPLSHKVRMFMLKASCTLVLLRFKRLLTKDYLCQLTGLMYMSIHANYLSDNNTRTRTSHYKWLFLHNPILFKVLVKRNSSHTMKRQEKYEFNE